MMAHFVAWEMFALMDGDELVGVCAKNPNARKIVDITDELAHLLHHRQSSTPVNKPSLDNPCPAPVVPGWTMRQCFDAKKCSCARGVTLGYQPPPAR